MLLLCVTEGAAPCRQRGASMDLLCSMLVLSSVQQGLKCISLCSVIWYEMVRYGLSGCYVRLKRYGMTLTAISPCLTLSI